MAYDSRVYRVLIASPSDVHGERESAVRVMQEWNNLNSSARHVVILPVRWETHTAPEYNVRPQEAINRMIVDDCDLVVAILWTKLGTPTGSAESGTLEEIERAAKAGKLAMLYFSHVPVDPNQVDLRQMDRLKEFRQRVTGHALIETYESPADFQGKFRNQLERKVRELEIADGSGQPSPLGLEFFSLETGDLWGSAMSVDAERFELAEGTNDLDPELKAHVLRVIGELNAASAFPVPMGIRNAGSSGVRNLYVEMSVAPTEGNFEVSTAPDHSLVPRVMGGATIYWPPEAFWGERERQLSKLAGGGLEKEGGGWKFSFEWEALQPQRVRLVQPVIYIRALSGGKITTTARVFADSFAEPITLAAELNINLRTMPAERDAVIKQAREQMVEVRRSGGVFLNSPTRVSTNL